MAAEAFTYNCRILGETTEKVLFSVCAQTLNTSSKISGTVGSCVCSGVNGEGVTMLRYRANFPVSHSAY